VLLHPEVALERFVTRRRRCLDPVAGAGAADLEAKVQILDQRETHHEVHEAHGLLLEDWQFFSTPPLYREPRAAGRIHVRRQRSPMTKAARGYAHFVQIQRPPGRVFSAFTSKEQLE